MASRTGTAIRWRIHVGIGTDRNAEPMDPDRAREDAVLIAEALGGFTLLDAFGGWDGSVEDALVIECIQEERDPDPVWSVAQSLTDLLNQAEVWVTEEIVALTKFTNDGGKK